MGSRSSSEWCGRSGCSRGPILERGLRSKQRDERAGVVEQLAPQRWLGEPCAISAAISCSASVSRTLSRIRPTRSPRSTVEGGPKPRWRPPPYWDKSVGRPILDDDADDDPVFQGE